MSESSNNITKYTFRDIYANTRVENYAGFGFASFSTPLHRHNDYYEITFVTSGVYTHVYNEHTHNLVPGNLILMAPHSVHQLYTEPMQATFYAICIQEDYFHTFLKQYFPDFAASPLPKCTTLHLDDADFTYLKHLGQQLSAPRPVPYIADTLTYLTLVNIFHKKNTPQTNKSNYVRRIIDILNEPASLNISVKNLYSAVDISTSTLIKLFKEETGYTIVEYKNKKKLELAANMIKSSNKKIVDIAYEFHYDSLSYFVRSFKKEFGLTPIEYRDMHRQNTIKGNDN